MINKNWPINYFKKKDKESYVLYTNLIFCLYFIFANIGLKLGTLNSNVAPIWPATGFAIGVILFLGYRYLPAIFLGAFLANYLTNIPLPSTFLIASSNTLEAFTGVLIIKAVQKNKQFFGRYSNTVAVFCSSMFAAMLNSLIGCASLIYFSSIPVEHFKTLWISWWAGDILGGIIILPLMIIFFTPNIDKELKVSKGHIFSLTIAGIILSYFLFIARDGAPFLFLVFPYLLYCVVKTGIKGVMLATLLLSVIGVISVNFGFGTFIYGGINANFINLQVFLASIGICSLVLSDLSQASLLKKPSFVLISTWLVIGLIYYGFNSHDKKEEKERFELLVESIPPLVDAKINLYFSLLQNGASLFAASEEVTRKEWKSFIDQGKYFSTLSALKWMGVVFPVRPLDLPRFIKQQKKTTSSFEYKQFQSESADTPNALKNLKEHFIVTFVEPNFFGYDSLGFDLASEKKRFNAAEASRDSNRPQVSDSVLLDTGKGLQPNFIAFYPFYKKGSILNTKQDRRNFLAGWIYGPIDVVEFYDSIFKSGPSKEMSFKVFGKDLVNPIYVSEEFESIPGDFLIREIYIGNQKFTLQIKRSAEYLKTQDNLSSWAGALAAFLSIFLGTFIVSLQSSRSSALTNAKRSNEELKASEELLKFALEGSGDAVWDWEIKKGYIDFSPLFSKMLGYEPSKELKMSDLELRKLLHPDDREWVLNDLFSPQNKKVKADYNIEFRMRCLDGSFKWFLSRGMIVQRDDYGSAIRLVGTITDISLRKQSEVLIENERTKFKAVFESSSDAIILFTEPWQVFDCNNAAVKMFLFESKINFLKQTPTTFSSMPLKEYEQHHFEWQFLRNNGETFPAEVALSSFDYNNKKIVQASIRDISERKRYEDSLRRQREMLVASAKLSSLGEMAGGIAHEINNPLSVIIGKVSQLKRLTTSVPSEKLIEEMNVIDVTAKRIAAIVKGLKSFSRNAEKDEKQKILIPTMMNDLIEISKERFKLHQINLEFQQKGDTQIYVYCRTAQLLQVLVNLLNNAFDAVEKLDNKWVLLELETKGNSCIISVTDSGPGIDQEIAEKIMSPFFTTKAVDKGTGLGLSISKAIIEEHDGRLYYDTTSANTKFVIELPLASAEDKTTPPLH